MRQLRPFVLDQLSHIVGDFRETLRLKQELVQPFEILLHHDMVGDNSGCITTLRFRRSHFFSPLFVLFGPGKPTQRTVLFS